MGSCSTEKGDLPTDVLYEIFNRLPLKPIFTFRCVSKLWNSLLSNPSLVHKVFKRITTSFPWAVVYNHTDLHSTHIFQTHSSNSHYNFINGHDGFSFRFLLVDRENGEKELCESCNCMVFTNLDLLASCVNGLVLYGKQRCDCDRTFHVCNPLTKQCVSVPPRPGQGSVEHDSVSLVSETSTTGDYKVVFSAYKSFGHTITFEIFSSDTGEWKRYGEAHTYGTRGRLSDMVLHSGILYWTSYIYDYESEYKMFISAYNLENNNMPRNQLRLINLPKDIPHYSAGFFGMSEGSIYYGTCSLFMPVDTLSVWLLEDDYCNGGWVWRPVHKDIEIKGHALFKKHFNVCCYFHPGDRNTVVFAHYSGDESVSLAYDLGTQTYEVLRGSPIPTSLGNFTLPPPVIITPKPTRIPRLSPSTDNTKANKNS